MKFSVNTAEKEVQNAVQQYLQKDENGEYIVDFWQQLPIFIVGPAGVGKTQIVGEIARKMGVGFVSYSLVHHTKQSLLGLPVITSFAYEDRELKDTEYTLSEVLGEVYKQIENGKKEGILFLDEANCCPETIQPILLSFLQSKMLGSNRLPKGWIIILCGNPPKSVYNTNARRWDGALMDRLRVIELAIDNKEYLQYVFEKDFHTAVKFYLTMHTEDAYICEQTEEGLNLVTYRTWENISKALYDYERLGFEVTPVMINEYIKVDRVVKAFYELYRYTMLDATEYTELTEEILAGNVNVTMMRNLKEKPINMLYGITNLCFHQLNQKAEDLLLQHEFLKEFKGKIYEKDFNINELLQTSKGFEEITKDLENIWKIAVLEETNDSCIKLHNKYVEELKKQKEQLVQETENFLQELEKLENQMLVRFYVNAIKRTKAWIYVTANSKNKVLERWMQEV